MNKTPLDGDPPTRTRTRETWSWIDEDEWRLHVNERKGSWIEEDEWRLDAVVDTDHNVRQ